MNYDQNRLPFPALVGLAVKMVLSPFFFQNLEEKQKNIIFPTHDVFDSFQSTRYKELTILDDNGASNSKL